MGFKQKRSIVTSKTAVQTDISSELEVMQRIDARDRRLFETTALACNADAYPLQIPLEGRTGPGADGADVFLL
jgi:hypothetical protein